MDKAEIENIISNVNDLVSNLDRANVSEELFPNIFIYGIPRSGTTLLSQVLIHCLDVGYVNNLIARFHKAPFIGAVLTRELNIPKVISFESNIGRTQLISDPNEFGYFWSRVFGYKTSRDMCTGAFDPSEVRMDDLKKEILALNYVFEKPCVFKSVLVGFFVNEISSYLRNSVFVYIERNPFDNAVSFLKARQIAYGSIKKWWSLKPGAWKELSDKTPEEQVAGQVFYLRKEYEDKIIGLGNILKVKYRDLCEKPLGEVEKVLSFVYETTDFKIKLVNSVEPFVFRRFNREDYPEVAKAVEKYFSDQK